MPVIAVLPTGAWAEVVEGREVKFYELTEVELEQFTQDLRLAHTKFIGSFSSHPEGTGYRHKFNAA